MAVVITGTTITAPDGALDAADLTGTLPALDGSALTDLDASKLTGTLPAIDGSALTGVGGAVDLSAGISSSGTMVTASGSIPVGALIDYKDFYHNGATVSGGLYAQQYTCTGGTSTTTDTVLQIEVQYAYRDVTYGTWRVLGVGTGHMVQRVA